MKKLTDVAMALDSAGIALRSAADAVEELQVEVTSTTVTPSPSIEGVASDPAAKERLVTIPPPALPRKTVFQGTLPADPTGAHTPLALQVARNPLVDQIGHPDNWWNTRVDQLPVYNASAALMAKLEDNMKRWHSYGPDGNGGYYRFPKLEINGKPGEPYGNHVNFITEENDHEVTWHIPKPHNVGFDVNPHTDRLLIPYHPTYNVQEFGDSIDAHLYVVDLVRGYLYEIYECHNYSADGINRGQLEVGLAKRHLLEEVDPAHGLGLTTANAAGSVYAPLMPTPYDFAQGYINHALPITFNNNVPTGLTFIEPAQHTALQYDTGGFLPYGVRLRLRKDFDVESIKDSHARTIFRAAQEYGFYHIDGINGDTSIPMVNDLNYDVSYQEMGVGPFDLYYGDNLPTWLDFEMIDGTIHNIRNTPKTRNTPPVYEY